MGNVTRGQILNVNLKLTVLEVSGKKLTLHGLFFSISSYTHFWVNPVSLVQFLFNNLLGERSSGVCSRWLYCTRCFEFIASKIVLSTRSSLLIFSFLTQWSLDNPQDLLQKSTATAWNLWQFLWFVSQFSDPYVAMLSKTPSMFCGLFSHLKAQNSPALSPFFLVLFCLWYLHHFYRLLLMSPQET